MSDTNDAQNAEHTHATLDGTASTNYQPPTEVQVIDRLECRPPLLPPRYRGYLQFYGYYIDEAWLKNLALTNKLKKAEDMPGWGLILWLQLLLRYEANYRHVHLKSALVDEEAPATATVEEGPRGVRQFPILIITAWEQKAWSHRPYVEQVKIMSEIMEMEPQWYIDAAGPNAYHPDDPTDYD